MKTYSKIIAFLPIFMLLFIFLGGAISPEWKLVSKVNGTVESLRADESQWVQIISQKFLKDGDKARTLDNSRAKILLADQSAVIVGSNTIVEIVRFQLKEDKRIVELKMNVGRIKAQVSKFLQGESTFNVKTDKAVLAAKGTTFYVDVQNGANKSGTGMPGLLASNDEGAVPDCASSGTVGEMVYLSVDEGVVEATTDKGTGTFTAGDLGYIDSQGNIFVNPSSVPDVFKNGSGWEEDRDLREKDVKERLVTGAPSTAPVDTSTSSSQALTQPPLLLPVQETTGSIHITIRSCMRQFTESPSFVQPPAVFRANIPGACPGR